MKRSSAWIRRIGVGVILFVAALCRGELAFEKTAWRETAGVSQEKVAFAFPFRNAGEAPVTITSIKSSCGCTTARLEKRTYEPGESGEITGEFRIGSRQGAQRKTVRLATDSVAQPQVLLAIEVDIPRLLAVEPGMLLWRKGEEPGVKAIRLLPNEELGVAVKTVELESEDFSLARVEAEPEAEAGPGEEFLVAALSTDRPARALIRITAALPDGREKQYFAHALVR